MNSLKKIMGVGIGAAMIALSGCNTVEGVGKDVTAAGKGVAHVAGEVRDEVFGKPGPKPRGYAAVGEPCDPSGSELRGGSGLPPCPVSSTEQRTIVVEPGR